MKRCLPVLAALAACLLSPRAAFAGAVDRVSFKVRPTVKAVLVSKAPGERRYRISSNSPFAIEARGVLGPVRARINRIGAAAQLPGRKRACRRAAGLSPRVIYKSKRRTAARPGQGEAQSVVITLRYSKLAKPSFRILPRRKAADVQIAAPCAVTQVEKPEKSPAP